VDGGQASLFFDFSALIIPIITAPEETSGLLCLIEAILITKGKSVGIDEKRLIYGYLL
jgi:hypothetical protein